MIKYLAVAIAHSVGIKWDNVPIAVKMRLQQIADEAQKEAILVLKQIHEVAEETPEQNREEVSPQADGYLDYCTQAAA